MMVLDDIRPRDARLSLVEVERPFEFGSSDTGEVEDLLRSMGFYFDLDGTGEAVESKAVTSWSHAAGSLVYRATLAHEASAMTWLDPYVAAVLATYGARGLGQIADLRLAIYELCRNCLDHGRPQVDGATLRLELTLERDRIGVSIEDDCQTFDPTTDELPEVQANVAARRRRGYGLNLVHRAVDSFHHVRLPHGNRIEIEKRIPR